jgi:hypothetical protein
VTPSSSLSDARSPVCNHREDIVSIDPTVAIGDGIAGVSPKTPIRNGVEQAIYDHGPIHNWWSIRHAQGQFI